MPGRESSAQAVSRKMNPMRQSITATQVSKAEPAKLRMLNQRFLDRLVERRGFCILYTHMGKHSVRHPSPAFPPSAMEAFRLLAGYSERKDICVTTTRRLLDHVSGISQMEGGARFARLRFPQF